MSELNERAEQLVAAALAGDLTEAEQQELDTLRDANPQVQHELDELTHLLPGLQEAGTGWVEAEPPAALVQAVTSSPPAQAEQSQTHHWGNASAPEDTSATTAENLEPAKRRRPGAWLALAAASGVVLGAGGTVITQQIQDAPPEGPPGTYGMVEDITFTGHPGDVTVDADLIAHTWGTETVLEIDGLEPGESFTVVLVADSGEQFDSGTFLGSELVIECRMNAAIMRDEVLRVEITDAAGELITEAELPEAIDPETHDA